MSRFHTLRIADVRRETPDAVSLLFDIPEEIRSDYRFLPGQYLTLRAEVDGAVTRRTYSICNSPDDDKIRVAIKRVDGGLFSTFANEALSPGMTLEVMQPEGRFIAEPDPGAEREYVAFAAGSGVTPVLSIVKTLLAREPRSRFTLFYGNRDRRSVMFREELEDLKDRFMDRFVLVHVLSQEGQDVDLLHGRLDPERVRRFAEAGLFDPQDVVMFFLCGPGDMIDRTKETLEALGAPAERIRFEMFTPADGSLAPRKPRSERAQMAVEQGVEVEALLDGAIRSFRMENRDASLIDAAHRSGIELPYSCKGGMCCTCRAKLVEGEVEMAVNYSLEPWELEAGFVLTCQSRPLTSKVVLDYDQV